MLFQEIQGKKAQEMFGRNMQSICWFIKFLVKTRKPQNLEA